MKLIFCLQINTKALSDEVDLFYLPKYKSLIQINIMILMGMTMHSYSFQNTKFEMSLHYLNKEFRGKVNFCMQMNKVSYKFIHFGHQTFLQDDAIIDGNAQTFSK